MAKGDSASKALARARRGEVTEAIADLKQLHQRDGESPALLAALGEVELIRGKADRAVKALQRAVDLGKPSLELLATLGWALVRAGRYDQALDVAVQARGRRDSTDHFETYCLYAGMMAVHGRAAEAAKEFAVARQAVPALAGRPLFRERWLDQQYAYAEAAMAGRGVPESWRPDNPAGFATGEPSPRERAASKSGPSPILRWALLGGGGLLGLLLVGALIMAIAAALKPGPGPETDAPKHANLPQAEGAPNPEIAARNQAAEVAFRKKAQQRIQTEIDERARRSQAQPVPAAPPGGDPGDQALANWRQRRDDLEGERTARDRSIRAELDKRRDELTILYGEEERRRKSDTSYFSARNSMRRDMIEVLAELKEVERKGEVALKFMRSDHDREIKELEGALRAEFERDVNERSDQLQAELARLVPDPAVREREQGARPGGDPAAPLTPGADAEGWVVIFRGSDPSAWNTDRGAGGTRAVPLERVPAGIRSLRLKRLDTNEAIVVPITHERLAQPADRGRDQLQWHGTNTRDFGGHHLGIVQGPIRHPDRDKDLGLVAVGYVGDFWIGSGFGHGAYLPDGQFFAWRGERIEPTEFEIAVTTREVPPTPDRP